MNGPIYTAETFGVINTGEHGWSVKSGDDTICDVYAGEQAARHIAALLNVSPFGCGDAQ